MNNLISKVIAFVILIIVIIAAVFLFRGSSASSANIELLGADPYVIHQNDVFVDPGYNIVDTTNENDYYLNIDGFVNSNAPGLYNLIYSLYNKKGVLVSEVTRQIIVLDDGFSNVEIYLKGDEEEYFFAGDYVDSGVEIYNNNENISDQANIDSNVKPNEIGKYEVKYQFVNGSDIKEVVRKVNIVNYEIEREIDEKNLIINLSIKCDGYSHTVMPDGTESYTKYISYIFPDVGSYEFDIYLKSGSHKKYIVDVKELPKEEKEDPKEDPKNDKPKVKPVPNYKITGTCKLESENNKTKVTVKVNRPSEVVKYIASGKAYNSSPFTVSGNITKMTIIAFNKANKPYSIKCERVKPVFSGGLIKVNYNKQGWFPCGTDVSAANKELATKIKGYGEKTRAAVATAAAYLANFHYDVQYFWAGKYDQVGLNPRWGCEMGVVQQQVCSVKTGANSCQWGLDCTGFRKWAFIQAGFPTNVIPRYGNVWGDFNGNKYAYQFGANAEAAKYIKAGDTVGTDNHVGVVVGVDATRVQVAHESGGIKITTLSKATGKSIDGNGDFTYFTLMDDFYKMYGKS